MARGSHNAAIAHGLSVWRDTNAESRKVIILATIPCLTAQLGMPPLRHEVAEHAGMSVKTMRRHLAELITEGRVSERGGRASRTLRVESTS